MLPHFRPRVPYLQRALDPEETQARLAQSRTQPEAENNRPIPPLGAALNHRTRHQHRDLSPQLVCRAHGFSAQPKLIFR